MATINRSRLTLASTLAAAIQAAAASPPITGSDGTGSPGTRNPSLQHIAGTYRQPGNRAPHAFDVGHMHAAPVDLDRRDEHHVVGQRVAADQREQPLPRLFGELLRIIKRGKAFQAVRAKHAGRHHQRPAQAPRPTSSTPATGPRPLRYSADSRVRKPEDLRITVRGGHVGGHGY